LHHRFLVELRATHQQTRLDVLGRKSIDEIAGRATEGREHDRLVLTILGQELLQGILQLRELRILPGEFARIELAEHPIGQIPPEPRRRVPYPVFVLVRLVRRHGHGVRVHHVVAPGAQQCGGAGRDHPLGRTEEEAVLDAFAQRVLPRTLSDRLVKLRFDGRHLRLEHGGVTQDPIGLHFALSRAADDVSDQVEPLEPGRELDAAIIRPFADGFCFFDQSPDALGRIEVARCLDPMDGLHDVPGIARWIPDHVAGCDDRSIGRDHVPEVLGILEMVWVEQA